MNRRLLLAVALSSASSLALGVLIGWLAREPVPSQAEEATAEAIVIIAVEPSQSEAVKILEAGRKAEGEPHQTRFAFRLEGDAVAARDKVLTVLYGEVARLSLKD